MSQKMKPLRQAANWANAESQAVSWAVDRVVRDAVYRVVSGAARVAVYDAVYRAVYWAVFDAVFETVGVAIHSGRAVDEAVREMITK